MKFDELESLFRESEQCDRGIFTEMRSNVLLSAGDHYTKRGLKTQYPNLRFADNVGQETRIRITDNHLGRITERLSNSIQTYTPDVQCVPSNPAELQDQKKAALHQSVKKDAQNRYELDTFFSERCDEFVRIGETHAYIYFDPKKGKFRGYEAALDEYGQPALDETEQVVADKSKPVMEGDFCWENIYGFNLLRDPQSESLEASPYLIMRKMGLKKVLTKEYQGQPEKLKFIQGSGERTFKVFDVSSADYRDSREEEVLLRYYFFRPSFERPQGYFYITTSLGILEEGELPLGLFPIVSEIFDRIETTPRGRSRIKRLRPGQGEINRAASKIAEHQITLGDDKLVIAPGAKPSSGTTIPGIRTISVSGGGISVIPGRNGAQYLEYLERKVDDLYRLGEVEEEEMPKGQYDAYTLIFASAMQRKKQIRYVRKFTAFKKKCFDLYLRLAKEFMPASRVVKIIGTNETMNVEEFKSLDDLSYEIVLEPGNEDMETKLGRQLIMSQTLQYVGNQMDKEQMGSLIKAMPYANNDEAFEDFTLNVDLVKNIMLSLERGQFVPPGRYDEHPYIIKKLEARMTKLDFRYLPKEIQALYEECLQAHIQVDAEKAEELKMAQAGLIPTTGAMVKMDLYVNPDPSNPNKVTRAQAPYDAIRWFMDKLQLQGVAMQQLEGMSPASQSEILLGSQQGGSPQGGDAVAG